MRYRSSLALVGGVLAVVPAVVASGGTAHWVNAAHTRDVGPVEGFDPDPVQVGVDGSLPQGSTPPDLPLPANELPDASMLPNGLLGIPGTALKAYHNAADIMAKEQPNCHLDWALIASIGRIESNHARGGYLNDNGDTREPILGPELDGVGNVAAIPDTDQGRYDLDTIWDRAVGPTQFIPSTWLKYASDGNGDGVANPNNIYDETLATGRHLCSGGLDLAKPDQLRAAVLRYNNSDRYVEIVLLWADAYRKGVLPLPDSNVPVGVPTPPALPAPPPLAPPAAPPAPAPATSSAPPPSTTSMPSTTSSTGSTTDTSPPGTPASGTPTPPASTTPSCLPTDGSSPAPPTTPTTTTPPTPTTTTPPTGTSTSPPPCAPTSQESPPPETTGSTGTPTA